VFEFSSDALGAQSQLGGGGRYDGLIEQLGGPPTPGVGFAAGIERILLASDFAAPPLTSSIFVAYTGDHSREAFHAMRDLRARGKTANVEQAGRSMKGQLKHANRLDATHVVILGDDGLQLKDMQTGEQRAIESIDEVP
jgi:histidyl-tRNA synthetase